MEKKKKALLLIDCQYDFINGSLAVPNAQDTMDALARYLTKHEDDYKIIIATCDWHPNNHSSFKEYGGQWPSHCVQHSVGAAIYSPILDALKHRDVSIFRKGADDKYEEYSFLVNVDNRIVFNFLIEHNYIEQIDVCGIAGDICVLNSITDMFNFGYGDKINVLSDFCPCIDDKVFDNFLKEKNLIK